MLWILLFGLVSASLGSAPTPDEKQASQPPPKPKEMSVFLQGVKRRIVKACFKATEKERSYGVSYSMIWTESNSHAITGYADRDAKARQIFKSVRGDGLLDREYELTFKTKGIRKTRQAILDENGNQVIFNRQPLYEEVYEISGSWRGYNRPLQDYAPNSVRGTQHAEPLACQIKDQVELIDIRCTVSTKMVKEEELKNAKEITVVCTVEDWSFKGSVYWSKLENLRQSYAAATAPALSGLRLRATSITMK